MHCSSENKIHKSANQNVQLTELELFVSYIVLNFIPLPAGFLSIYSLDLYIKQKKKINYGERNPNRDVALRGFSQLTRHEWEVYRGNGKKEKELCRIY